MYRVQVSLGNALNALMKVRHYDAAALDALCERLAASAGVCSTQCLANSVCAMAVMQHRHAGALQACVDT